MNPSAPAASPAPDRYAAPYVRVTETSDGQLSRVTFNDTDHFNFAYDIVDRIADETPDATAMLHLDHVRTERLFSFGEMKRLSDQVAHYLVDLGIGKGDAVMLMMKRHWQFWPTILALHKIGAIAIPATYLLKVSDFVYRFRAAGVTAVISTPDGDTTNQIDEAVDETELPMTQILAFGRQAGWDSLDDAFTTDRTPFPRTPDTPGGDDPMLMFFTSGTTGYPKIVRHSYTYPLAHYITARYWHDVTPGERHFTIADTGWGKALWGKLYGQWMCGAQVFTYDFDRFDPVDVLPMLARYDIRSFCAPPTIYRMMIRADIGQETFRSVRHATTAGEAMNPEVLRIFKEQTGLDVYDGFGQTESTLMIGNLRNGERRIGALGQAVPIFDVCVLDQDGQPVPDGTPGEICVRTGDGAPIGLMMGYDDPEMTEQAWHDGYYHTGDVAYRDADGFFWYVGRMDDMFNSAGYRIGPVEVESVIIELPYVLECAVTGIPDPVRGLAVHATIVLTADATPSDALKKEIQTYVKHNTAPYKYPRSITFSDALPKSVGGKVQRYKL